MRTEHTAEYRYQILQTIRTEGPGSETRELLTLADGTRR